MQRVEPIDLGIASVHVQRVLGFVMEDNLRLRRLLQLRHRLGQQLLRTNRLLQQRIEELERSFRTRRIRPTTRTIQQADNGGRIIIESYARERDDSNCDSTDVDEELEQMCEAFDRERARNSIRVPPTGTWSEAQSPSWSASEARDTDA